MIKWIYTILTQYSLCHAVIDMQSNYGTTAQIIFPFLQKTTTYSHNNTSVLGLKLTPIWPVTQNLNRRATTSHSLIQSYINCINYINLPCNYPNKKPLHVDDLRHLYLMYCVLVAFIPSSIKTKHKEITEYLWILKISKEKNLFLKNITISFRKL